MKVITAGLLSICLLTACVPDMGTGFASTAAGGASAVSAALQMLREGRFATALSKFQSLNVFASNDASGVMGLAIAADMEGRFSLSARAYKALEGRGSSSAAYLNNLGYSYMLRGELPSAYVYLTNAQARDPSNQIIAGNLEMLNAVLPKH